MHTLLPCVAIFTAKTTNIWIIKEVKTHMPDLVCFCFWCADTSCQCISWTTESLHVQEITSCILWDILSFLLFKCFSKIADLKHKLCCICYKIGSYALQNKSAITWRSSDGAGLSCLSANQRLCCAASHSTINIATWPPGLSVRRRTSTWKGPRSFHCGW